MYKILSHKISEEKRFVGSPWRRWEDNIESDLEEIGVGGILWFGTRNCGGHVLTWQC